VQYFSENRKAQLEAQHYAVFETLLDDELLGYLRREGQSRRPLAVVRKRLVPKIGDTGRVASHAQHFLSSPGPVLQEIHESEELVAFVGALLGKVVFPTRASYLYYEPGDYVGLHQDVSSCELTLLVNLFAGKQPFTVHPELSGVTAERLLEVVVKSGGFPEGGVDVVYPENGAIAIMGELPHQRPLAEQPATIAVLCFKGLW